MDNEKKIQRIKQVMQELNLSQSQFAEKIGIDPSNLSKYLSGKQIIRDSLLNKIVVKLKVSDQWLHFDRGPMWDGNDITAPVTKECRIPTVSIPMQAISANPQQGAKVYGIDVTAGNFARERMFASDLVIGSINVPSINSDCSIVKVSGDSMQPVICNGDMIAIREITNPDLIFWGQIYVILLDDYRMVKYIRKHNNPKYVVLRSANPDYDDIDIQKSDIRDLFIVENIIHIDNRI